MGNVIHMDTAAFVTAVNQIKTSGEAIDPKAEAVEEMETVSEVVAAYEDLYSQLEGLMKTYKAWVQADIEIMTQMGQKLIEMDQTMFSSPTNLPSIEKEQLTNPFGMEKK